MGVHTGRFTPDKANNALREQFGIQGPLILFVGRLAEKKGVTYLLDAMPNGDDAISSVAPNDCREWTRPREARRSDALGLDRFVIFTGAIENERLPELYARADVFVGPRSWPATATAKACPSRSWRRCPPAA